MNFLLKKPIVFFDLETTGILVGVDRVVQLAAVKIFPDRSRQVFDFIVNPLMPIHPNATAIHGISDMDVQKAPTFKDISLEVLDIFRDSDIAGFNIMRYDLPILMYEFERVGIDLMEFAPFDRYYFDVSNIHKVITPNTLSAIYKRYTGKEIDGAHDALVDVEATIELLDKMFETHEEIPRTPKELDRMSAFDKDKADLSGWFYLDGDGQYRFSRGKHKDEPALSHYSYICWVIDKSDLPPDTKYIARKIKKAILTKRGVEDF